MNWHLYGYSWWIPSLCLRLARGHPSGCWSGDTARTKYYLIVSCAECFLALSSSGVSDPVTRHQKPEWGGQPVPLRASGGLGIQVLRGPHAQMAGSCLSSRAGPRPDRWMLSGLSAVGWPGSLGLGQWGMPAVFLVHTLCLSSLPSCPYRTTKKNIVSQIPTATKTQIWVWDNRRGLLNYSSQFKYGHISALIDE